MTKSLLKASGWLFLDRFTRMGIGFATGVLIARHYGPASNGELAYVIATSAIFGCLGSLGLDEIGPRDFAAGDRGVVSADIQRTTLVLRALSGSFAYLLLIAFMGFYQGPSPITILSALYSLYLLLQATDVVEYRFRAEGRFRKIAILRSTASVISGSLKVVAIEFDLPLIFIAGAMLAEFLFASFWYLLVGENRPSGRFKWDYAIGLLRRSRFIILAGTLYLLQARIDSLLTEYYLGLERLGQYAAAMKLIELFDAVAIVLSIVLVPEFAKRTGKAFETIARRAYLIGILLYLFSIPFMVLIWWLFPSIYGASYLEGQSVFPYMILRPLFVLMGFFRAGLAVAEGKHHLMPIYPAVALVFSLILGPILIPGMGLEGAAISTIGGLILSSILVDLLVYRRHLLWIVSSPMAFKGLIGGLKS